MLFPSEYSQVSFIELTDINLYIYPFQGDGEEKDSEKRIKNEREKLLNERKVVTELALKLAEEVRP